MPPLIILWTNPYSFPCFLFLETVFHTGLEPRPQSVRANPQCVLRYFEALGQGLSVRDPRLAGSFVIAQNQVSAFRVKSLQAPLQTTKSLIGIRFIRPLPRVAAGGQLGEQTPSHRCVFPLFGPVFAQDVARDAVKICQGLARANRLSGFYL